jgi:hypothetical protein
MQARSAQVGDARGDHILVHALAVKTPRVETTGQNLRAVRDIGRLFESSFIRDGDRIND